mmetsp:Transcript_4960/g.8617  ORF Transcript_4960/g.8617 Transcript_4960/m.8617 type:complete len:431 (+) Transcript_4960:49-1341(+)
MSRMCEDVVFPVELQLAVILAPCGSECLESVGLRLDSFPAPRILEIPMSSLAPLKHIQKLALNVLRLSDSCPTPVLLHRGQLIQEPQQLLLKDILPVQQETQEQTVFRSSRKLSLVAIGFLSGNTMYDNLIGSQNQENETNIGTFESEERNEDASQELESENSVNEVEKYLDSRVIVDVLVLDTENNVRDELSIEMDEVRTICEVKKVCQESIHQRVICVKHQNNEIADESKKLMTFIQEQERMSKTVQFSVICEDKQRCNYGGNTVASDVQEVEESVDDGGDGLSEDDDEEVLQSLREAARSGVMIASQIDQIVLWLARLLGFGRQPAAVLSDVASASRGPGQILVETAEAHVANGGASAVFWQPILSVLNFLRQIGASGSLMSTIGFRNTLFFIGSVTVLASALIFIIRWMRQRRERMDYHKPDVHNR